MTDYGRLLQLVRRHTGDHFTAKNGYHARKLNFGQKMAVLRYAEKISDLISKPYIEYAPKRGEKSEAFEYTGQKGWRFFQKAIVHKPDPEAELEFRIDRERPKGSRFVPVNKKTGQRYYHIPAQVFLGVDHLPNDFVTWLLEQGEDIEEIDEDVLRQYIIEYYAGDAEFFLIQAGESYMWGSGGGIEQVSDKIGLILNTYGSTLFTTNSKSHYSQWFKGVTGFTNRFDIVPAIGEAQRKRRERAEKYGVSPNRKARILKDGSIGLFENGMLVDRYYT